MNLFDHEHENGPLMREKSRAATEGEAKAYVTWLRERRGLRLFDNIELHSRGIGGGRNPHFVYWAATFGKCLKPSRWEGREQTAPEYQEGAYSIVIPGHDQLAPRVTMETLGDDGEVIASQTLPVEPKKGGVIWDREAVRKAHGPIAKPAKAKRGAKVAKPEPAPMPEIASPEPAQDESAPIAAQDGPEVVEALHGPDMAPDEPTRETCELPVPAPVKESLTTAPDLDAITARLDALEQALATLSAVSAASGSDASNEGAQSEATPTASAKRTPAHERAIRRAWAERKAARGAQGGMAIHARRIDALETELRLAKDEQALDKQALGEAYARAEQFARRGNQHRDRRLASARRARRMIAAARAERTLQSARAGAARAEIDRLKRDMADPSQPERASDIARLVMERDQARTALAAMAARAERAEQGVHAMADRFEGLVSRVTKAEAALRQSQAA